MTMDLLDDHACQSQELSAVEALQAFLDLMVPYVDEFDVQHVAQGYALLARIDECYGTHSDDNKAMTLERATARTIQSVTFPLASSEDRVDIIEALYGAGLPMPKLDTRQASAWQRAIDEFTRQDTDK